MGKNREIQKHRRAIARQRQLIIIAGVIGLALALIGLSIYQNNRPLGAITPIAKEVYPHAQGKTLGSPEAQVLIQEFADFQCPFCGKFAATVEKQLIEDYVATGQVKFEFHHYIVVDGNVGGSESRRAAEASECANAQGEFWNYQALVYANQNGEGRGAFSDRRLKAFAETLGLDLAKFNSCFDSGQYAQAVLADEQLGRSLGVNGTPTLFIDGVLVQNPLNYLELQTLIESGLAAAR